MVAGSQLDGKQAQSGCEPKAMQRLSPAISGETNHFADWHGVSSSCGSKLIWISAMPNGIFSLPSSSHNELSITLISKSLRCARHKHLISSRSTSADGRLGVACIAPSHRLFNTHKLRCFSGINLLKGEQNTPTKTNLNNICVFFFT